MNTLPTELRNLLERTVINARDEAEKAAKAALIRLAVHQREPYPTLSLEDRQLRNRLRAEARRLGETSESQSRDKGEPFPPLVAEVAYAQWHRMLFARFLAENHLLMHPEGVAVTLEECAELAADEGVPDAWMLAARYASAMLPGIFRTDDPILQVRFDAAGRLALERLLNDLPAVVFTAEDSLGWVYQFWQARSKEEVNKSGRKIGGADLAPVTQLFTEPYMVQFLLHNSLGAWWATRHPGETFPISLDYLRWNEDGTPAAGQFSAWPERAADLHILDPCCGSGHFLVAAFALLCRMRMQEENLSEAEAGDAVIRDNLFGLELDPRCTQIAAFALALAAWKAGGYRELPLPNIACTGLPVGSNAYEFTHLADGDSEMEATLRRLHHLFQQAPDLGSLIDPERVAHEEGKMPYMESMFAPEWRKIAAQLDTALTRERADDPAAAIFGATAKGVARAADFLARRYHLVITNVPYLARGKQADTLRRHIETFHNDGKADLATAFVDRCLRFCTKGGSVALVTPQNWLFLDGYKHFRKGLLEEKKWLVVAKLGPAAFSDMNWWAANTAIVILANDKALETQTIVGLDASSTRNPAEKPGLLRCNFAYSLSQAAQLKNPDGRIVLSEGIDESLLLSMYAYVSQGISPGDSTRYVIQFWEVSSMDGAWRFLQSTPDGVHFHSGLSSIIADPDNSDMAMERGFRLVGNKVWGQSGIAIGKMRQLPTALYLGTAFDANCPVIIPNQDGYKAAIWTYVRSEEYKAAVRKLDQKLDVAISALTKVPFDLEHWKKAAAEQYPNGLPEPQSDDPTQWLFNGHPVCSTSPMHVAVARLLGYRWPQNEDDGLERFADDDSIVCLPPVAGEPLAVQRLRELLAAAYGQDWTPAVEERLLADAEYSGQGLDVWLQDGFFTQHCRLFHNRPFLWHICDGRKDGFSAIVNYHRLDRANLERLIYTYLGAWINAQRDADNRGIAGANARLVAALSLQEKLKAILDGEPPYDIYMRWKPLHKQPIGWEPDINDGVRLNIRPFVTAGVLRAKFSINWNKDRGTNPDGSERLNDLHLTRAEKEAARRTAS